MSPEAERHLAYVLEDVEQRSPGPIFGEWAREIQHLRGARSARELVATVKGGIPFGEVHFVDHTGRVVGRIVNLGVEVRV